MVTWNSRFIAFARAHGRTPSEQVRFDDAKWPGGPMVGFQLWITQQLREAFDAGHRSVCRDYNGLHVADQRAWDEWLERPGASRILDDPAVDTESKSEVSPETGNEGRGSSSPA